MQANCWTCRNKCFSTMVPRYSAVYLRNFQIYCGKLIVQYQWIGLKQPFLKIAQINRILKQPYYFLRTIRRCQFYVQF